MTAKTKFEVPFFWADPAGVLFFGYLFSAAHQAWETFAHSTPGGWKSWFGAETIVYPIRHVEADYFAPMPAGQAFEVFIHLESITESTFILSTEFRQGEKMHAKVKSVHTALDPRIQKKAKITPEMAKLFNSNLT